MNLWRRAMRAWIGAACSVLLASPALAGPNNDPSRAGGQPAKADKLNTAAKRVPVKAAPRVSAPNRRSPVKVLSPPAEGPMQVYLVRSAMPGCEPNCTEWIAAQGRIEAGSVAKFKKVLRQMGDRRLPVLIDSTGGTVEHGLAVGRLIRSRQLDVAVSKTEFVTAPCAVQDAQCRKRLAAGSMMGTVNVAQSKCASACVFVLAGGTRRTVSDRTWVGVHQFTSYRTKVLRTYRYEPAPIWGSPTKRRRILVSEKVISGKNIPTPRRDKVYGVVKKYFAEMGIGDELMELLFSAPSTSIRWLAAGELTETGIATDLMPIDTVIMEKAPEVPRELLGPPVVEAGAEAESASSKNATPIDVAPSAVAPATGERQGGSPEL